MRLFYIILNLFLPFWKLRSNTHKKKLHAITKHISFNVHFFLLSNSNKHKSFIKHLLNHFVAMIFFLLLYLHTAENWLSNWAYLQHDEWHEHKPTFSLLLSISFSLSVFIHQMLLNILSIATFGEATEKGKEPIRHETNLADSLTSNVA